MRHAAPRGGRLGRKPNRAREILLAGIAYTIAGLATGLTTLGSALAVWGLWQWLGVN